MGALRKRNLNGWQMNFQSWERYIDNVMITITMAMMMTLIIMTNDDNDDVKMMIL